MPNYQLSKIYRIEPNNSDCDGDVYYGSSCEPYLSRRIDGHRSAYKRWLNGKNSKVMVYELFEKYGVENCSIVLVENFSCDSKEELHAREKFYIKNNKCVNKNIPLRRDKEYREDNIDKIKQYSKNNADKIKKYKKEYYDKNADKVKETIKQYHKDNPDKRKQYREDNADKIKQYREDNADKNIEYKKQYYINNTDKIKNLRKIYRKDNADKIKEKRTQPFNCVCGSIIQICEKANHLRSLKHLAYIEQQQNIEN